MGQLIEHSDETNPQVVRVGDRESKVSIKVYQDIYHQITGRTEQVRKRYSNSLLIEFSDIEQLHHKIMQLCDIHKVIASNEVVSIFHEQERKEQFTSFDRFRAYNSNASSPSLNVVLKYNFSIIPAGIERPQEYVVTIKLVSRVAMLQQIEADLPSFVMRRLVGFGSSITAEITVDYADYIIARGFLSAFEEWINGCKSTPESAWLSAVKKWSYLLPNTISTLISILIIYFALASVPNYFGDSSDLTMHSRFFIVFSGGFFIVVSLMRSVGRLIEESIDSYLDLSYLKLNKGDVKLIDDFGGRQRRILWKFIGGCLLSVLLGFTASQLAEII
jgi:hypothetical protein